MGHLRLLAMGGGRESVHIIKILAPRWKLLGDTMDFDCRGSNVQLIESQHAIEGPVACCREVLQYWLCGNGSYQPPTWENFIQLLQDIEETNLATMLRDHLSSFC